MTDINFNLNSLNNSFISVIILDKNKKIIDINETTVKIMGYKKNEVLGKSMSVFSAYKWTQDEIDKSWEELERNKIFNAKVWMRHKSGELFGAKRTAFINYNEQGEKKYVFLTTTITTPKKRNDVFDPYQNKDAITGLASKILFKDMIEKIIRKNKKANSKTPIIYLDTNRFRQINEAFGYDTGDDFLKYIAKLLIKLLDEKAFITRISGDLFGIIFFNAYKEKELIKHLNSVLKEFTDNPFLVNGEDFDLNLNIGVSLYPDNGETVKELLRNADLARHKSMEEGGNCLRFYNSKLNDDIVKKLFLEKEIKTALNQKQFVLYYQPQFNLNKNKIDGFEALIRWEHPKKGMIPPNLFIPVAEESDLILEIGEWVIEEACKQIKIWEDKGYDLIIDVNISSKELEQPQFVDIIKDNLEKTKINPVHLGIEITESAMISNMDKLRETVIKIKELGLYIGIDDFGTGFSSLSHLIDIPINFLKIDRSFVFDIKSKKNKSIITATTKMAKEIGLEIVAEGVETLEHIEFLKLNGCDYLQGYFYSKPVTANEAEVVIKKFNKD